MWAVKHFTAGALLLVLALLSSLRFWAKSGQHCCCVLVDLTSNVCTCRISGVQKLHLVSEAGFSEVDERAASLTLQRARQTQQGQRGIQSIAELLCTHSTLQQSSTDGNLWDVVAKPFVPLPLAALQPKIKVRLAVLTQVQLQHLKRAFLYTLKVESTQSSETTHLSWLQHSNAIPIMVPGIICSQLGSVSFGADLLRIIAIRRLFCCWLKRQ